MKEILSLFIPSSICVKRIFIASAHKGIIAGNP